MTGREFGCVFFKKKQRGFWGEWERDRAEKQFGNATELVYGPSKSIRVKILVRYRNRVKKKSLNAAKYERQHNAMNNVEFDSLTALPGGSLRGAVNASL